MALATAACTQDEPVIASDTVGGTFVAWRYLRSGSGDIYAQHLSAHGAAGLDKVADPVAGRTLTSTVEGGQNNFWEFVGRQFAVGDVGYSYMVPGPGSFVVSRPDTGLVDAVAGSYFYKLCAADIHGNLSTYALVSPQYASGVAGQLPAVAILSQNAPNPFNPRTTIRCDLPTAGTARLAIYDVAGRLVRTLADGGMAAGAHEVIWDGCDDAGRGQSLGSYLARLAFGGRTETSRMMLIR